MIRYRAYNTLIYSPKELNLKLDDSTKSGPAVELIYHNQKLTNKPRSQGNFRFFRGHRRLLVKDYCGSKYLSVQDDKLYIPPDMYESAEATMYMIKTVLPLALMHQQGQLMLHGSAFAINRKAYVILGQSGAGKSTLAAFASSQGAEHLADDSCRLFLEEGVAYAARSGVGFCLFPGVAQRLGYRDSAKLQAKSRRYGNKLFYVGDSLECRESAECFRLEKVIFLREASDNLVGSQEQIFFSEFLRAIFHAHFLLEQEYVTRYVSLFQKLYRAKLFHQMHFDKERDFYSEVNRVFLEIRNSA